MNLTSKQIKIGVEAFKADVFCCARCATDHRQLSFMKLTRPSKHTHWAWCPVVEEPLMLRIVLTKPKRKSKCPKHK